MKMLVRWRDSFLSPCLRSCFPATPRTHTHIPPSSLENSSFEAWALESHVQVDFSLCHLPVVWPWGGYLTSLCFCLLICNTGWYANPRGLWDFGEVIPIHRLSLSVTRYYTKVLQKVCGEWNNTNILIQKNWNSGIQRFFKTLVENVFDKKWCMDLKKFLHYNIFEFHFSMKFLKYSCRVVTNDKLSVLDSPCCVPGVLSVPGTLRI